MDFSAIENIVKSQFKEDPELNGYYKRFVRIQEEEGLESDSTISAGIHFGQLLLLRGIYLESLGLLNYFRGILQDRRDNLHPLMAEVLASLGDLYLAQGMHVESLPYYEKALSVREALCISDNEETARLFMKTGEIHATNGDVLEAEDFFNRAYQVASLVCPESVSIRGDISNNLAVILTVKKEFDRAVGFYKEAAELRVSEYGQMCEESAQAYLNLAKAYQQIGNSSKQAQALYKALEIREELYGIEDPTVSTLKDQYQSIVQTLNVQEVKEEKPEVKKTSISTSVNSDKLTMAIVQTALLALEEKNIEVARAILSALQDSTVEEKVHATKSSHEILEFVKNNIEMWAK